MIEFKCAKRALAVVAVGLILLLLAAGGANAGDDQADREQELRILRADNNLLKSTVEARNKEIAALKAELAGLKAEVARLKAGVAQSQPVGAPPLSSTTTPSKPPVKLTAQQLKARAALILKKKGKDGEPLIYIKREPAIGRIFVNVNLTAPIDPGSPRLASQVYISIAEKGDAHLRLAVECFRDDLLFIRRLLFRLEKEDTEISVPLDVAGSSVDIEIGKELLTKIAGAKKAYLTAIDEDGRQSAEITDVRKQSLRLLLEYTEILDKIGPIKAGAIPSVDLPSALPRPGRHGRGR